MRNKLMVSMIIGIAGLLGSCKQFSFPFGGTDDQLLAKVGKSELYLSEVHAIFAPGITPEDSLNELNSYVDRWVKKQLKIQIADHLFSHDQDDIDSLVSEYRNSLLIYKYEQHYINEAIDTTITSEQLGDYYATNLSDFTLLTPIVKCRILRVPLHYRKSNELKKLLLSSSTEDLHDLTDICDKNDFNFTTFDKWTEFTAIAAYLPPLGTNNLNGFIEQQGNFYETTDKQYTYFLKITAYKLSGESAPREIVQDLLRSMITNKRKRDLIQNLEDSLYRKGVAERDVELNVTQNNQ